MFQNTLFNKKWWEAALIRALRTFGQTAGSFVIVGLGFSDLDWVKVLSVSGVAFLASLLTSLGGLPEVEEEKSDK